MKKIIGILILILFYCNFSFADIQDVKNTLKKIKSNKDISMGFKKFLKNNPNLWRRERDSNPR